MALGSARAGPADELPRGGAHASRMGLTGKVTPATRSNGSMADVRESVQLEACVLPEGGESPPPSEKPSNDANCMGWIGAAHAAPMAQCSRLGHKR